MRKLITLLVAVLLTASVFAQSPEKMSYQAVIRDASDNLVTNHSVGMQISILQGSETGSPVYVETQTPTTNSNGLVSIEIGAGSIISGSFASIDWTSGPYFLKTETDPTGGTSYSITGTSELLSVPYALYSAFTGDTSMWKKNVANIYYNKGNVGIGTSTPGEGVNTKFDVIGRISFRTNSSEIGKVLVFDNIGTAQRLYTDALTGNPSDLVFGTYPNGHINQLYLQQSTGNVGIGTSTPGEGVNTKFDVIGRISFRTNSSEIGKVLVFDNIGTAQRLYTDALTGNPSDLVFGTYPNGHINQLYLQQSTGNVGIGTSTPGAKLDVNGSVKVSNDATAASANNVGAIRYRTSGNNSYCEMVMQTAASSYSWVIIKQNSW